jgi:hypothetical protein
MIASDFARQPSAAIPQASPDPASAKGAYRFIENESIDPDAIAGAHREATLKRIREQNPPVVLAVQDTSFLDYSNRPKTTGLGPTGSRRSDKNLGLLLHPTLALTPQGVPLGLLDHIVHARDPDDFGGAKKRHERSIEDKESSLWLESVKATQAAARACAQSTFVNIADREGDIYEVLAQTRDSPVHMLVRSRHNRKLKDEESRLWDTLASGKIERRIHVDIPGRGGRRARRAQLNIRFQAVELAAPSRKKTHGPLSVWAILAEEPNPPKGVPALRWKLLGTHPVETPEAALEQVGWYARRWGIEELFKTLKSGCRVEARRMQTARRLERAIVIDLVIAWRILALTRLARVAPGNSVEGWLERAQWEVLWCQVKREREPPNKPPTIGEAVLWIARLGGHSGCAKKRPPGTMTLWRGLQRLVDMALIWEHCREK